MIETIFFYKHLIFNPHYGRVVFFAIPYFIIFKIIGPWIEIQGYLMVLVAGILGLLNISLIMMLFAATIMMGTFISISSFVIAGSEIRNFTKAEVLKLILYSIIENFGFRQLISFWRCVGYFNAIRSVSGWGKMERKGFSAQK